MVVPLGLFGAVGSNADVLDEVRFRRDFPIAEAAQEKQTRMNASIIVIVIIIITTVIVIIIMIVIIIIVIVIIVIIIFVIIILIIIIVIIAIFIIIIIIVIVIIIIVIVIVVIIIFVIIIFTIIIVIVIIKRAKQRSTSNSDLPFLIHSHGANIWYTRCVLMDTTHREQSGLCCAQPQYGIDNLQCRLDSLKEDAVVQRDVATATHDSKLPACVLTKRRDGFEFSGTALRISINY